MLPRLSGLSGMFSFQQKMAAGLAARGIEVTYELEDRSYSAILVVGGSRRIGGLLQARRRGIPVIQRLDGMNWMHRVRKTGLRHYLRAEYGNALLALIRSRLASHVVYQSNFARRWWQRSYGPTRVSDSVVYNGVDLELFTPAEESHSPDGCIRLLVVEGNLAGGYELGLENAVRLAETLSERIHSDLRRNSGVELMVVGRVSSALGARWTQSSSVPIRWAGAVAHERIPEVDRSAHLLFSADLNAACPNSVIEALACGTPVVGYATGALPELVTSLSGKLAPYGGDPWRLDPPDVPALAGAAVEILRQLDRFRSGARQRAVDTLGRERMVDGYLQALLG